MYTDESPAGADPEPSVENSGDVRMSADAVEEFLDRRGWGCLTLASDGDAYAIPMSFGYDGDGTLYFFVQADRDGRKMAYLDATRTATFLVPEIRPPSWTSAVVRGGIERVPDENVEAAYAAFAANAWFPACPWTGDRHPTAFEFYRLDADEMTGRSSSAAGE
ncbi:MULTISPECIES: pyridoxamine 5'-phosphate oxidase family protein [Halorussus]|uniref:pyridoxamine 5'-phosphate oxidase family protein n=1 Tax=Halorussus TaxID=1070314 RepID=UPI000E20C994|nr:MULTISPECIES: pyridoxamine 5'-phosphate oxidase family protein [Halorussus]